MTTAPLVRAQARWALRQMQWRPSAVVACTLDDHLSGWEPDVLRVLYGTDDYVAGAALLGLSKRVLLMRERRQLANADVTVAVSPTLVERWSGIARNLRLIPNGVSIASYENVDNVAPASDVTLPRPVAGVVGHLSSRIDIALLEAVVGGGCSLLMVGPKDPSWERERFNTLIKRDRVAWVGSRQFQELPGYFRHMDVGLTPYADINFNRASFPLKTLEYLAAGLPVVSTDLPATRWLETDLIKVATEPVDFVHAVHLAANEKGQEIVKKRRDFASKHSWEHRAAEFAHTIRLGADQQTH